MTKHYTLDEIHHFMRSISIMSAAMVAGTKPVLTTLLFALDHDFTLYFACHADIHKARALMNNPAMSISVWEHEKMLVQAAGTATKLVSESEIDRSMDLLVDAASKIPHFWPPILQIRNDSETLLFALKLEWLRALDLSSKTITVKEPPFSEYTFGV